MNPDHGNRACPAPNPGDLLADRFRLLSKLGAGAMGEVWVAEQLPLERRVAIKLMSSYISTRADAVPRFELEARALASVDDEHVIRVLDFGRDPTFGFFLSTEFVEGSLLGDILERAGRFDPNRAVHIVCQILEGLSAAHAAGIVHRDLKPDNVMLVRKGDDADFVKLLDFGIAKFLQGPKRVDLTEAGMVFGTPAYLSPEQALARPVDHRADLYACGIILFQVLAGRLPFDDESPSALVVKHVTEPPPPLPPDAGPRALADVIRQALSKDPEGRFTGAKEMAAALRRALAAPAQRLRTGTGAELLAPPASETRPRSLEALRPPPAHRDGMARALLSVRIERQEASGEISKNPGREGGTLLFAAQAPGSSPPVSLKITGRTGILLRLTPQEVARQSVEGFGGKVSWLSEEGLLAEFVSPTDTLHCAAAIQDRIAEEAKKHGWKTSVRAAVSAGEVILQGRALFGEAVAQVELLAQGAESGQVLFTHSVYLAMTKSEVVFDEHPGKDPSTGQKIYRLLPLIQGNRLDLPFHGGTLARAYERKLQRLARFALRAALFAVSQAAQQGHLLLRLCGLRVFETFQKNPRRVWQAGGAAFVGAILVFGAVFLFADHPSDAIETALRQQSVARAVALAERWVREDAENANANAWLGRSLAEAGDLDGASHSLREALERDADLADEDDVARAMVRCLDRSDAKAARAFLLSYAGDALEKALLEGARSDRANQRRNAVRVLKDLGRLDVLLAIYDKSVRDAPACKDRAALIRWMGEIEDPSALPLLERIRDEYSGTHQEDKECRFRKTIEAAIARSSG